MGVVLRFSVRVCVIEVQCSCLFPNPSGSLLWGQYPQFLLCCSYLPINFNKLIVSGGKAHRGFNGVSYRVDVTYGSKSCDWVSTKVLFLTSP